MDLAGLIGIGARVLCVFALLGATLWVLQRVDGRRRGPRRSAPVQVLASTRLAKGAALSVVQVGDTEYVLGVTDAAVSLLSSRPTDSPEPAAEAAPPAPCSRTAPPGTAAFLGDAWRVARRRPLASDEISAVAVAAALQAVTTPYEDDDEGADGTAPLPATADRRPQHSTDARPHQEHPWAGPDRMPQPAAGGGVQVG